MEHERKTFMQRKHRKSSLKICIHTFTYRGRKLRKPFFSPSTWSHPYNAFLNLMCIKYANISQCSLSLQNTLSISVENYQWVGKGHYVKIWKNSHINFLPAICLSNKEKSEFLMLKYQQKPWLFIAILTIVL